jgi:hypothetical protein
VLSLTKHRIQSGTASFISLVRCVSADPGAASASGLVLLAVTCLACALAAQGARALPLGAETLEAIAIGIVLAVLVDLVPRLTGSAAFGLAMLVRELDAPYLRGQLAANGSVVIQNITTALLFGTFIVSLRSTVGPRQGGGRDAGVWIAALALVGLADGAVTANASGPSSAGMLFSLVVVQATRAFAQGCALVRASLSRGQVAAAACACGAASVMGSTVGRAVGFQAASLAATPLLMVAAILLVVAMSHRLSGAPRRGAARTLIGFGLGLGASRLLAANAL